MKIIHFTVNLSNPNCGSLIVELIFSTNRLHALVTEQYDPFGPTKKSPVNVAVFLVNFIKIYKALFQLFTNGVGTFFPPRATSKKNFPYIKELNLMGVIMRGLSILSLLLTILTYTLLKKTRKGIATKILVSLGVSLICLWLVLYVAETRCNSQKECWIYNALRYYFVMVSLMWNAVEAQNMYRMLVVVYYRPVDHFVLVSSCIAWGLPILMVLLVLTVDAAAFDGIYLKCSFRCGLKMNTLYYAWLSPMLIIIFHNSLIYLMVVGILFKDSTNRQNDEERKNTKSRLAGALILLVLLGVPWILSAFGAIKNEDSDSVEIFKGIIGVLLVTFISLQGLFIFLFHCACNESVRREWRSFLICTNQTISSYLTVKNSVSTTTNTRAINFISAGQ
ncbi:hypothetical protein HELRODRAFT_178025 [Helobdella robusta]|uniref:G-protein coupled receptors family 2 profile 2 domain-containing protein n=1 Tax=Helobdella robusta TaxID=6412 RepID=T1FCM4_HELRO|nr:hypothetical protein HELRODRAFT_178025 [Helobdella robusta]ESN97588.1 hypothetical protein HELRODRAFT_178025 [Helobdella robusta]